MRPTILVTGKLGQIGYEMDRVMSLFGNVIAVDIQDLDLSNADAVSKFIRHHKPAIIVNSAGYTSVDTAESNSNVAMKVNGIAPGIMAEELKRYGGLMVHFSTDFAFDGVKNTPYVESDTVNPLSVYAKTKTAGDDAVMNSGVKHLIFRTGWVYGARSKNFLLTMLSMCQGATADLKIVNDQFGAPTWCRALSEGVALVLNQKQAFDADLSGVYHISCAGMATWYEFAVQIAKYYERKHNKRITIYPVSSGDYPMRAKRPAYSVLDNTKLRETFGVVMPDWQASFRYAMEELGYEG